MGKVFKKGKIRRRIRMKNIKKQNREKEKLNVLRYQTLIRYTVNVSANKCRKYAHYIRIVDRLPFPCSLGFLSLVWSYFSGRLLEECARVPF